jgi:hypothetical protein
VQERESRFELQPNLVRARREWPRFGHVPATRPWSTDVAGGSSTRLHNISKTGEDSRGLQCTQEDNKLTTRQRITKHFRRKSRAINQLAFWGGAGSTPAASTKSPFDSQGDGSGRARVEGPGRRL